MNTPTDKKEPFDVVIIGGGASGTALLYTLSKYTDLKKIALIEKYADFGQVNSAPNNNSQTLHVGDIETNYTIDKVRQVKPASMMVARYAERVLEESERKTIIHKVQKMLLAVGKNEVEALEERFEQLKPIFPDLQKLGGEDIAKVEPGVMKGRDPKEDVRALFSTEGYAVNFGALSKSFVRKAQATEGKHVEAFLKARVKRILKEDGSYIISTSKGIVRSRVVIVDTDAYSLGFAKSLGYGEQFSLIPIAGSFYFTKELLKGKVYTVQESGMPFAAVHGDPDMTHAGTRFGPTARFFPVLEARKLGTMDDYFQASGLQHVRTLTSFFSILLEPVRFKYLVRNILYEFPYYGKYFFAAQVRKIIPAITGGDLRRAKGYGGMRLQRVDTETKELLLGEGKIMGDNIIFNMTPSPGASVCLYNALRDAIEIEKFFKGEFRFDEEQMMKDLGECQLGKETDVSLPDSYPS